MNTKKGLNPSGFTTGAYPMSKYSDLAWSDAGCFGIGGSNNIAIGSQKATDYLTTGDLNLMSRFSFNSSLTLNTAATDSDTTSSSTSSSSATNNSSSSLSLSPANERDTNNKQFYNSQTNIKPPHQASNHLLELQKEIKEEEEEIFADINSLINSRSNLFSTFNEDIDDGVNFDEDSQSTSTFNQITATNRNNNNNNSRLQDFHNHTTDETHFNNSSEDLNDYQSQIADDTNNHDFQDDSFGQLIKHDEQTKKINIHQSQQHRYDHKDIHDSEPMQDYVQQDGSQYPDDGDDHQQDLNNGNDAPYYDGEQVFADACNQGADQQDYHALQAVIQQVTSNLPKPCVFFLEGNCRRSDCKYSHDLSNITCKYWIEGFCFKGEMCPFLHSYNAPSDSSLLDDDALQSISKKELNPTFVIESEADFPSLPLDAPASALNDGAKSGINTDLIATSIKNQILSSNPAVVFKTVKKKRKRG